MTASNDRSSVQKVYFSCSKSERKELQLPLAIILCTVLAYTDTYIVVEPKQRPPKVSRENRVTKCVKVRLLQPVLHLICGSILVLKDKRWQTDTTTNAHLHHGISTLIFLHPYWVYLLCIALNAATVLDIFYHGDRQQSANQFGSKTSNTTLCAWLAE